MVRLVSTGTLENHLVSPVTPPVGLEDLGRGPTDTGGHVAAPAREGHEGTAVALSTSRSWHRGWESGPC